MITYLPDKMLSKIAPARKIEKLVSGRLTLNKTVLSFLDDADFISKKNVTKTALKVLKQYKERYETEKDSGSTAAVAKADALNDKKLLVNQVQNTVVWEIHSQIKENYNGEYYIWLPSDAQEPDPEHQLNYGKRFQIGVGEMPGFRIGCRCGMQILVKETELEL